MEGTAEAANPPSAEYEDDPLLVLKQAFPFRAYIEGAEHRAITIRQLIQVVSYAADRSSRWEDVSPSSPTCGKVLSREVLNLYHVNAFLILPATMEDNCSFVELLAEAPQDPSCFVSHWWGERILAFMECIQAYTRTKGFKEDASFWICAYANRQHSLTSEISRDPRETSFHKAMCIARTMLLVLDSQSEEAPFTGPATPFMRSWCAFEASMMVLELRKPIDIAHCSKGIGHTITEEFTDSENKLEKKTPGSGSRAKTVRESTFPLEVMCSGLEVNIEEALATQDIDRVRILNSIARDRELDDEPFLSHDNYNKVNRRLRAVFAIAMWPQAVQRQGIVSTKKLAIALAADEWRKNLAIHFAFCTKLDDTHLAILAAGIPKKLLHLELHFRMCQLLGNPGLKALCRALPKDLETLTLNCQLCPKIGVVGVDALGLSLPTKLVSLRLNFEMNTAIHSTLGLSRGIYNLANLRVLDLNFAGVDSIDDTQIAILGESLSSRKLLNLYLSLQGCHLLTGKGVQALTSKLPPVMTILHLNFSTCDRIDNDAVKSLAVNLPGVLKVLHFNLQECSQVEESSVGFLVQRLPPTLHGAKVNLIGTKVAEHIQRACRRLETMKAWIMESSLSMSSSQHREDARARALSIGSQAMMAPGEINFDFECVRYATPTASSKARFARSAAKFFPASSAGLSAGSFKHVSPTFGSSTKTFSVSAGGMSAAGLRGNDVTGVAVDPAVKEPARSTVRRSESAPVIKPGTPPLPKLS